MAKASKPPIFGDDNANTFTGTDASEIFFGLGGDLLLGNGGNDSLEGGAGADKFMILKGDGVDRILDFGPEDKIDLGAFGFTSPQAVIDAFRQEGLNAVLDLGPGQR